MARFFGASLLGLLLAVGEAAAQRPALGLSAGAALPGGALGSRRTAAPYAAASVLFRSSDHVARFRVDLDVARFWGRTEPGFGGGPIDHGDLTVTSALGHLVLGHRGPDGFYSLLGIGMHWMAIPGRRNPYGTVWGVGTGLGVKLPVRRATLEVELRAHAILSDYGNSDFEASYFLPVTLGVRF